MQPPPEFGKCENFATFWFAENWKIFEFALMQTGPYFYLLFRFFRVLLARPIDIVTAVMEKGKV